MTKRTTSENPFYGKKELLTHFNASSKDHFDQTLYRAAESIEDQKDKELFHIINFAAGDITNRQHNVFRGRKVDGGGEAAVKNWMIYLRWLILNTVAQFIKFLPLIVEFVGLRELVTYQVRTKKKTKKVTGTWGLLKDIQANADAYEAVLTLLVRFIKQGSEFQKYQVAKFISIPKFGKRNGKPMQKETIEKMFVYQKLLVDLSARMNWVVEDKEDYKLFIGFKEWRKPFNKEFEYYLFSTGEISNFSKSEFHQFIDSLPANGRFKVEKMLFSNKEHTEINEKWTKLAHWYKEWETFKEDKQEEERKLEEKKRTQGLSFSEELKLEKVKKQAKVPTGANKVGQYFLDFLSGNQDDKTIHSLLNLIQFKLNIMPVVDMSGSMGWGGARNIAKAVLSLVLYKNPDTETDAFIGFGTRADVYTGYRTGYSRKNKFLQSEEVKVNRLVDRTKPFIEAYNNVSKLVNSNQGGTNISSVFNALKEWAGGDAERMEQVLEYPIFLFMSDGEFNNSYNAASSIQDFQMKMRQHFGHEPVIALWDVTGGDAKSQKYNNLENVVYFAGTELSTLNTIFTNLTDMDIVDIYSSLNSIYKSNRYELVKTNVI